MINKNETEVFINASAFIWFVLKEGTQAFSCNQPCFVILQVCYFVALYYNVIIGWSLFYFSQSFQNPLPWYQCPLVKNASFACKTSSFF